MSNKKGCSQMSTPKFLLYANNFFHGFVNKRIYYLHSFFVCRCVNVRTSSRSFQPFVCSSIHLVLHSVATLFSFSFIFTLSLIRVKGIPKTLANCCFIFNWFRTRIPVCITGTTVNENGTRYVLFLKVRFIFFAFEKKICTSICGKFE